MQIIYEVVGTRFKWKDGAQYRLGFFDSEEAAKAYLFKRNTSVLPVTTLNASGTPISSKIYEDADGRYWIETQDLLSKEDIAKL